MDRRHLFIELDADCEWIEVGEVRSIVSWTATAYRVLCGLVADRDSGECSRLESLLTFTLSFWYKAPSPVSTPSPAPALEGTGRQTNDARQCRQRSLATSVFSRTTLLNDVVQLRRRIHS